MQNGAPRPARPGRYSFRAVAVADRTNDRYARSVLLTPVCPYCLDARERKTRDYREPRPCPDCGALLMMSYGVKPHLVLKCRACGTVFEGVAGQPAPGLRHEIHLLETLLRLCAVILELMCRLTH